jgi:hypothetical protein
MPKPRPAKTNKAQVEGSGVAVNVLSTPEADATNDSLVAASDAVPPRITNFVPEPITNELWTIDFTLNVEPDPLNTVEPVPVTVPTTWPAPVTDSVLKLLSIMFRKFVPSLVAVVPANSTTAPVLIWIAAPEATVTVPPVRFRVNLAAVVPSPTTVVPDHVELFDPLTVSVPFLIVPVWNVTMPVVAWVVVPKLRVPPEIVIAPVASANVAVLPNTKIPPDIVVPPV